jgi:hypothetical protein
VRTLPSRKIDDHEPSWVKAPATLSIQIDIMIWDKMGVQQVNNQIILSTHDYFSVLHYWWQLLLCLKADKYASGHQAVVYLAAVAVCMLRLFPHIAVLQSQIGWMMKLRIVGLKRDIRINSTFSYKAVSLVVET